MPTLTPVDRIALEWAWGQGEEAGAGTATLPAADWQFLPLRTTLGTLAVLTIAQQTGAIQSDPTKRHFC